MGIPTAGSIELLELDGIAFDVAADSNVSLTLGEYENDTIATSGKPMRKKTKRLQNASSISLVLDSDGRDQIAVLNDQIGDINFAITLASGDAYRSSGQIKLEDGAFETEENRVTISLLPREAWSQEKA